MLSSAARRACSAILVLVFLLVPQANAAESLTFVVIGDTPYDEKDRDALWDGQVDAVKDARYPFLIHVGDFLAGGDGCNTEKIVAWRKEIYSWKPGRVFYTPGDNEWTDCDRSKRATLPAPGTPPERIVLERNLGRSLSELDRLDLLRRTFYPAPLDLPDDWNFASQPGFPENARWTVDGVQFATVHMVGTNNGRTQILLDDVRTALALVAKRDAANRAWLDQAFAEAKREGALAVVVATQADVTRPKGQGPCAGTNLETCDAFAAFRDRIGFLARQFEKPVLLVHGDTNPCGLDKDFGGAAGNLWRLNASGDGRDPSVATEITVALDGARPPFSARELIGSRTASDACNW